jgi:hypothetical protein
MISDVARRAMPVSPGPAPPQFDESPFGQATGPPEGCLSQNAELSERLLPLPRIA